MATACCTLRLWGFLFTNASVRAPAMYSFLQAYDAIHRCVAIQQSSHAQGVGCSLFWVQSMYGL